MGDPKINKHFKRENSMNPVQAAITGHLQFNLVKIGLDHDIFKNLRLPVTIEQLSQLTGCDKRFLREWCEAMVLADFLIMTPSGDEDLFQVTNVTYDELEKTENYIRVLECVTKPVQLVS